MTEAKLRECLLDAGLDPALVSRALDRATPRDTDAIRATLKVLWATDLPSREMAEGLGVTGQQLERYFRQIGKPLSARLRPQPLEHEYWRPVPGYRCTASNLGRVKSHRGRLLQPKMRKEQLRVLIRAEGGRRPERRRLGSVVLAAFGKGTISTPVRYRNGDPRDCRLANLAPHRVTRLATSKNADRAWTAADDRVLARASSLRAAAETLGRSVFHTERRAKDLGLHIARPTPPPRRDLVDRDLEVVQRAVRHLESAGLEDRAINLALGFIASHPNERETRDATARCVTALYQAGFKRAELQAAFGWSKATVMRRLQRQGLINTRRPKGWQTPAGPVDTLHGESWAKHPSGYWVSDLARITRADGQLVSTRVNTDGTLVVSLWSGTRQTTTTVAKLVVETFRPGLSSRCLDYLNGDRTDARLANIVPRRRHVLGSAAPVSDASTAPGSRQAFQDPLWAAASAACPRSIDGAMRDDVISAMVVLVLEGRATDMKAALRIAWREYDALMGTWKERSLDTPAGDDDGRRLTDLLGDGIERF